jgi:hypothetical protein
VRITRIRYDHSGKSFPSALFHPSLLIPAAGRCFALVEFHRRSDAEKFLDRYYPDISFPLEHSRGVDSELITVSVCAPDRDDMEAPRNSRREDDGWECVEVWFWCLVFSSAC